MLLDRSEFQRRSSELYGAQYLSTIGIIQNIALGILAVKFAEGPLNLMAALQSIGSLLVIMIVTNEYAWWLLLIRRTPDVLDHILPYLIGIAEFFSVASSSETTGSWFFWTANLGIVAAAVRLNMRRQISAPLFVECRWLLPITRRNFDRGNVIIVAMTVLVAWSWLAHDRLDAHLKAILMLEFYVFSLVFLAMSGNFLIRVRDEFEKDPILWISLRPRD